MYFAREIDKRQALETNPLYSDDHTAEEPKEEEEPSKHDVKGESKEEPKEEPKEGTKEDTSEGTSEGTKGDLKAEDESEKQPTDLQEKPTNGETAVKEETENGRANDEQPKAGAKEDMAEKSAPKPSPSVDKRQPVDYFSLPLNTQVSLLHLLCEVKFVDTDYNSYGYSSGFVQ